MYPAGIFLNTKTGRFHPILFRPAPLPGGSDIPRYRSLGHHTDGFDSLEDAVKHIDANPEMHASGRLYDWDGNGVPALTDFFS